MQYASEGDAAETARGGDAAIETLEPKGRTHLHR
jgi:hypothetical protein